MSNEPTAVLYLRIPVDLRTRIDQGVIALQTQHGYWPRVTTQSACIDALQAAFPPPAKAKATKVVKGPQLALKLAGKRKSRKARK